MRRLLALLLALAAPAAAQDQAAETAAADAAARERVTAAIAASGFRGTYLVHAGPRRIAGGSAGAAVEGEPGGFEPGAAWPWPAAVGGRLLEVIAWQEVERGRLPAGGDYRVDDAADMRRLAALLERRTGTPLPELIALRIAGPLGLTAGVPAPEATAPDAAWPGGPTPDERRAPAAAPVLAGTAHDLATFDRALLGDALLPLAIRARMWRGQVGLRALPGCAAPVRVVERRGAAGRFAAHDLLAPDQGIAVVLLSNGGIGAGTAEAAMAAVLCG